MIGADNLLEVCIQISCSVMSIHDVTVGDFIQLDGLIGVVIRIIPSEDSDSNDHLAVWFGAESQQRVSEGGTGNTIPQVWTVPAEYCEPAQSAMLHH